MNSLASLNGEWPQLAQHSVRFRAALAALARRPAEPMTLRRLQTMHHLEGEVVAKLIGAEAPIPDPVPVDDRYRKPPPEVLRAERFRLLDEYQIKG